MAHALERKGIKSPRRAVFFAPPANVWRLFRRCKNCTFVFDLENYFLFILEVLRCIYGLNDAPLAWQYCLEQLFLEILECIQSKFDDNFYFYMWTPRVPSFLAATHVDDNGVGGTSRFSLTFIASLCESSMPLARTPCHSRIPAYATVVHRWVLNKTRMNFVKSCALHQLMDIVQRTIHCR